MCINAHSFELIAATWHAHWTDSHWMRIKSIHILRWFECLLEVDWIIISSQSISTHTHSMSCVCVWKPDREHNSICLPQNFSVLISFKLKFIQQWQLAGTYHLGPRKFPEWVHKINGYVVVLIFNSSCIAQSLIANDKVWLI